MLFVLTESTYSPIRRIAALLLLALALMPLAVGLPLNAQEPKAEEPKVDEPKAEEPKAEVPKAEAPKAEAPKADPVPVQPKPEDGGAQAAPAGTGEKKEAAPDKKEESTDKKDVKLRFRFAEKPWESVIKLFAEEAGLALTFSTMPPGTFTYADDQAYSPAEAIDLLNNVLLTKGYALVRHQRMLFVINLEDGIPPALVEAVPLEELDERGKYEIIKCVFPLKSIPPDQAEAELKPLLGPQGNLHVIPTARQVMVTETAGNLRMIRSVIEWGENPSGGKSSEVAQHALKFISAEEALLIARPLLGLAEDTNVSDDIKLSVGPLGSRLFATGKPELIQRLASLIPQIDKDPGVAGAANTAVQKMQLVVHNVTATDSETVLAVMQSLLAGQPGVRLAIDPVTGNLVAYASQSDQEMIRNTLGELQRDRQTFEIITLKNLDLQTAILSISKLFGIDPASETGPKIDGDLTRGQLFVRGSQAEVEQIRQAIDKLESVAQPAAAAVQTGNVRFLPLNSRSARRALEAAEVLWPTTGRSNRIRIITPGASSLPFRQPPAGTPSQNVPPSQQQPPKKPEQAAPPKKEAPAKGAPAKSPTATMAHLLDRLPIRLVSYPSQLAQNAPAILEQSQAQPKEKTPPASTTNQKQATQEKPAIVVTVSPGGLVIASQDTEALNDFQRLLQNLIDQRPASGRQFTVFPLTFAKAQEAAQLIQDVLSAAAGNAGADVDPAVASVISQMGGALQGAGEVSIIPDSRLNTLIVQGAAAELDLVEQLLEVVDRESSIVDVQTSGRPRLIPVFHTSAEEVAEVVRQVYANRIEGGTSQRGGQTQDIAAAFARLRGGNTPGGRRSGGNNAGQEQKFSLGVDPRSNSLVITAVEPLFQEIKALVEQLDRAGTQSNETMRVVTLKRANPELVQKALQSLVGTSVKTSTTTTGANNGQTGRQPVSPAAQDQFRQQAEMFNRIQRFRAIQGSQGGFPGGSFQGGRPTGVPPGGFQGGFPGRPSRGGPTAPQPQRSPRPRR